MTENIDPRAGFEFRQPGELVDKAFQDEKLSSIGLDPGVFGDQIDPSFFIGMGIRAGAAAGISAEGNVNMLSRIIQYRPVPLGDKLVAVGRIEAVDPVPRGRVVTTDVWFENEAGEKLIAVPRKSLKPDPDKKDVRGAGDRPAPVVQDVNDLELRGEYTLTPEAVCSYSMEGNAIHYEMDAANRAGFRAPIIGGGMGVHFMLAELWGERGLAEIELDVYFRRPVFWDDTFQVGLSDSAMALVRDGKVLTEVRICGARPA
jgi:acyl dehydratase